MRLKQLMRSPLALPLVFAVSMATWLVTSMSHRVPTVGDQGVVWVYEVARCAAPGDASDCQRIDPERAPFFESRDACAAYLHADLGRAGDPRRMGSCLRQREA